MSIEERLRTLEIVYQASGPRRRYSPGDWSAMLDRLSPDETVEYAALSGIALDKLSDAQVERGAELGEKMKGTGAVSPR